MLASDGEGEVRQSMRGGVEGVRYLFDREEGVTDHLIARWLFLRALGAIYFSAFCALLFQVRGMIGTQGILPAGEYLQKVRTLGALRFWYAPTLLWWGSGNHALMALVWVGLVASVLVVANVGRGFAGWCALCAFCRFIAVSQDFRAYQSDGMLLEAGFLSLFLAPAGLVAGVGADGRWRRGRRCLLLLWEWFRIYFESGAVKLLSGDPTWRNLTAMYEYYQNGPLPTWIGWYLQHLPHWFQRATAGATLGMELVLVWMAFLPRRWRIVCFLHRDGVADRGDCDGELCVSELPGAGAGGVCCWMIVRCGGLCRGGGVRGRVDERLRRRPR